MIFDLDSRDRFAFENIDVKLPECLEHVMSEVLQADQMHTLSLNEQLY